MSLLIFHSGQVYITFKWDRQKENNLKIWQPLHMKWICANGETQQVALTAQRSKSKENFIRMVFFHCSRSFTAIKTLFLAETQIRIWIADTFCYNSERHWKAKHYLFQIITSYYHIKTLHSWVPQSINSNHFGIFSAVGKPQHWSYSGSFALLASQSPTVLEFQDTFCFKMCVFHIEYQTQWRVQ